MQLIDGFLVATTREGPDDRLEELCLARVWACRGGSEFEVLDRVWRAAHSVQAKHVLIVGGDQPLFAWQ
ncbi:MAG: hypothetical protein ACKOD5_03560, partial [Chthoniobacterales bacterium]